MRWRCRPSPSTFVYRLHSPLRRDNFTGVLREHCIRIIHIRKLLTPSPSTRLPSHLSHLCVCSRPGHPAKTRSQIRPSRSSGPRHADSQVACDELDLKLRLTKAIVLVAAVVAVLALPVCMCARAETREQENAAPAAKRAHQHQRGSPSRSQLLLLCMAHHP